MQAAAVVLRDCQAAFGASPEGIFDLITGSQPVVNWHHYPAGGIYDPKSHAQYFYHRHPTARDVAEHGHFHTFLRAGGMPAGVAPLVLPEIAIADALPPQAAPPQHGERNEVSHIVAVALNLRGEPVRLFTTNRWVTGETWYGCDDVIRMIDHFTVEADGAAILLNRWVAAVVALFRPQIVALLRLRDKSVVTWRRRCRTNVFEDARLEITSSVPVDLKAQIARLTGLDRDHDVDLSTRTARLPRMAEGWAEASSG
jgi:hypothetical protein